MMHFIDVGNSSMIQLQILQSIRCLKKYIGFNKKGGWFLGDKGYQDFHGMCSHQKLGNWRFLYSRKRIRPYDLYWIDSSILFAYSSSGTDTGFQCR